MKIIFHLKVKDLNMCKIAGFPMLLGIQKNAVAILCIAKKLL